MPARPEWATTSESVSAVRTLLRAVAGVMLRTQALAQLQGQSRTSPARLAEQSPPD